MKEISDELYGKLRYLGIISEPLDNTRNYNIGSSNYSDHIVQPWTIWLDWELNAWDADIIKRVLRTKAETSRKEDYEKIIHICQERIRQIDNTPELLGETIVFDDNKYHNFENVK